MGRRTALLEIRTRLRASAPPSPRPPHHDEAEVAAALDALSDREIARLVGFARFRIMRASRCADTDAEDLFADAALLTLKMKRKWRRGISLFNHLVFLMRNICAHRSKCAAKYVPILDSHPAPTVAQSTVDAEECIASLERALQGDSIALEVLETMRSEIAPRHAQKQLRISAAVYWAARKRIRRLALALEDTAHGY